MVIGPGTTGKTSVKVRSVKGDPPPLVMVKVAVLTLPGPMVSGVKTFDNVPWAIAVEALAKAIRIAKVTNCRPKNFGDVIMVFPYLCKKQI